MTFQLLKKKKQKKGTVVFKTQEKPPTGFSNP